MIRKNKKTKRDREFWAFVEEVARQYKEECEQEEKKTGRKIQPPYLGDPVWESKHDLSIELLNICDSYTWKR